MKRLNSICCVLSFSFFTHILTIYAIHIDTNHTIIYEDPSVQPGRPSYFGYSIVIYSGQNSWIRVGAPRANSIHQQKYVEPGAVYHCNIEEKCEEQDLSNAVSEKAKHKCENVTNGWIGGSMILINGTKGDAVLVCSHRCSIDIKKSNPGMPGACYFIPAGNNSKEKPCKLIPLAVDATKYFSEDNEKRPVFGYLIGQLGISAHQPKMSEGHQILLGSPGVNHWKGAVIHYERSDAEVCKNSAIKNHVPKFHDKAVSYFGYAISSGYLFSEKKQVYIASAPRAYDGRGAVLIYEEKDKREMRTKREIQGKQLGEYFGASLICVDINNDKYDDLIIGAPRYSTPEAYDQGRIYIIIGGKLIESEMRTIEGKTKKAQFGLTVAALGDINNDGFQDVAVGAPYENGNSGSVHIYFGSKKGLDPGQIIRAADISPSLKGFGISIHYTSDTCSHNKTYMAIGSYLSGHAVILRRHPGINLHIKVNSSIKIVGGNDKQFLFSVCSWYDGPCSFPHIIVNRKIHLDPEFNRIYITERDIKKFSVLTEITLRKEETVCDTFTAFLNTAVEEAAHSIIIYAAQKLINIEDENSIVIMKANGSKEGVDRFCRNCSVVNHQSSNINYILKLPFANCSDSICYSDLHLQCKFPDIKNGTFVIGSKNELRLLFSISNKAEPAYQTSLILQVPQQLRLVKLGRDCYRATETTMICNLNTPVRSSDEKEIMVEIDMTGLTKNDLLSVTFHSMLNTTSINNSTSNACSITLNLVYMADMHIDGKSLKEVVPYSSESDVLFEQLYKVYKVGESPVMSAKCVINIPYALRLPGGVERDFLDVTEFQVRRGQYYEQFLSPWSQPINSNIKTQQDIKETELTQKKTNTNFEPVYENENQNLYFGSSDKILHLNCSNVDIICRQIVYESDFITSEIQVHIHFSAVINMGVLGLLMKEKKVVLISTNGKVFVERPKRLISTDSHRVSATVTTPLIPEEIETHVELWIIIVSAVCGILLLFGIIFVLIKVGFFRRKKKEDLKQLMATSIAEEFYYQNKKGSNPPEQALETTGDSMEAASVAE